MSPRSSPRPGVPSEGSRANGRSPKSKSPEERRLDDQLMVRCGRGDVAALEALMGRHQGAAYRYAWRIFRNHHTAEDVTQEFFVKLFRNASRYDPRGHFTTYFYRVLGNLCFDLLRKRKRRARIQAVQLDPIASEGTELEPLQQRPDFDATLRREEARDTVHQALADLPIQVRRALELREFEGLRYREIAEVLELSLNEVKVLLHRGRKLLGRALATTTVGREWKIAYQTGTGRRMGGAR